MDAKIEDKPTGTTTSGPRRFYARVTDTPRLMVNAVQGSANYAFSIASPRLAKLAAVASAISSPRMKSVSIVMDRLSKHHDKIRAAAARRLWYMTAAAVGFVMATIVSGILLIVTQDSVVAPVTAFETACQVFCEGPILHAVQMSRVFPDSKTFVDMPLLVDPSAVSSAFASTFPYFKDGVQPTKSEIVEFVGKFFSAAGSDMLPWVPNDWQEAPPALMGVRNETIRGWLLGLNGLFLTLGRQISADVRAHPERHTLIWQPFPLIVPGGRFIETYYWDSLWITLGLLRCGMVGTALGVVANMEHLLNTFGFLPNGSRAYYALPGRSQPPLLSSMVAEVYAASGNSTFLRQAYPSLRAEWEWWMQTGEYGHALSVGKGNRTYRMNRYVSDQHIPRPESYAEDVHTAKEAGHSAHSSSAQILYSEIAAAAESGWDFTSRWFGDGYNISTAETSHVIPVELNVYMYVLESDLASFASILAAEDGAACRDGRSDAPPAQGVGSVGRRSAIVYCKRHPHAPVCSPPHPVPDPIHAMSPARAEHSRVSWSTYPDSGEEEVRWREEVGTVGEAARPCSPALVDALTRDAARFTSAAAERASAIEALMWDEGAGAWADLRIAQDAFPPPHGEAGEGSARGVAHTPLTPLTARYRPRNDLVMGVSVRRSGQVSSSNYLPLWAGLGLGPGGVGLDRTPRDMARGVPVVRNANASRVHAILASLRRSGLVRPGGLASTRALTPEQWDGSNAWAPINHMIIQGLDDSGVPEAQTMARELARRWLSSNLAGYTATAPGRGGVDVGTAYVPAPGAMYEKYNADVPGTSGGKGEYEPQTGFGWTNGVALDLAVRYDFAHLEEDVGGV